MRFISVDSNFSISHTWDMDRYAKQIPKLRGYAFLPQIRFATANERDAALPQMHVQAVWDCNNALEAIEGMELPCLI